MTADLAANECDKFELKHFSPTPAEADALIDSFGELARASRPRIFKAEFSDVSLEITQWARLFDTMRGLTLSGIDLQDNHLTDDVADSLVRMLDANAVQEAELERNGLGDATAYAVAKALRAGQLASLVELDMSSDDMSPAAEGELRDAASALRKLKLRPHQRRGGREQRDDRNDRRQRGRDNRDRRDQQGRDNRSPRGDRDADRDRDRGRGREDRGAGGRGEQWFEEEDERRRTAEAAEPAAPEEAATTASTTPTSLPDCDVLTRWKEAEVISWVAGLNPLFEPYGKMLHDSAVSGEMLVELSAEDLEELGVQNRFHRGRITREIRRLKQKLVSCDQETI